MYFHQEYNVDALCVSNMLQLAKEDESQTQRTGIVKTEYYHWCCKYFAQSVMNMKDAHDPESSLHYAQEYRYTRASKVRQEAQHEQRRAGMRVLNNYIAHI